jgi:hypothetical protein
MERYTDSYDFILSLFRLFPMEGEHRNKQLEMFIKVLEEILLCYLKELDDYKDALMFVAGDEGKQIFENECVKGLTCLTDDLFAELIHLIRMKSRKHASAFIRQYRSSIAEQVGDNGSESDACYLDRWQDERECTSRLFYYDILVKLFCCFWGGGD